MDDDRELVREQSKIENCRESSVSGDSNKSFSSLITTCEVSTEEIRARKIRIMALAALRRGMKLKVIELLSLSVFHLFLNLACCLVDFYNSEFEL